MNSLINSEVRTAAGLDEPLAAIGMPQERRTDVHRAVSAIDWSRWRKTVSGYVSLLNDRGRAVARIRKTYVTTVSPDKRTDLVRAPVERVTPVCQHCFLAVSAIEAWRGCCERCEKPLSDDFRSGSHNQRASTLAPVRQLAQPPNESRRESHVGGGTEVNAVDDLLVACR